MFLLLLRLLYHLFPPFPLSKASDSQLLSILPLREYMYMCVCLCMHAYVCICTICTHIFPRHTLLCLNNVSHIRADHLALESQLVYVSMERKHFSHSQPFLVAFKFLWTFPFFLCLSVCWCCSANDQVIRFYVGSVPHS